jgi:hypothetical protein
MKFLPIAVTLSCAALLAGCGHPSAGPSEADQQAQERLEEEQARQLSQLHEQQAAIDERERLLEQREQQLAIPVHAAPAPAQPAQPEEVAQEAATTPAAPAAAIPTPAVPSTAASYQSFYNALSAYGSWVQMPGYGYVWQPLATQSPVWRPYTLGHWVYTDEGWTWVSDEPFGWITYHYGRWMRTHTLGWVWVPGDQWAPAWVSWRYGDDFVGWAPLPPEATFDGSTPIQQWADQQYNLGPSDYTFVPAAAFGDDDMAQDETPPDQEDAIYDDSNNITDIYYDPGAYAIICYGPNYDFMRSKARRPLHAPFTLRRSGFLAGGNNRAAVSGNTLQVAAPAVVRDRGTAAPRAVRTIVADARLVLPRGVSAPPAPDVRSLPISQISRSSAAAGFPSRVDRGVVPQAAGEAAAGVDGRAEERQGGFPAGAAVPASRAGAVPGATGIDAQRAHDLEVIQQEQAEREQRMAEEARAVSQAQSRAEETIRAQRAPAEANAQAAANVAREQAAAREQAPAHEATLSRPMQPASLPSGAQPPGRGQQ